MRFLPSLRPLAPLALAALCVAPVSAQQAAPEPAPARISFLAGPILTTTGIGVSGQARFNRRFSASLDLSFLPFPDIGTTYGGEEVTMDSAVRSAVLMGHYHPKGGSLALGLGAYFGNHRFDFEGTPSPGETVDINGTPYGAQEIGTLMGEFAFMSGPALLLEVGTRGAGYVTSFGLGIPSGASVELTATGDVVTRNDDRTERFRRDTEAEVQNVRDFAEAWPVVVYARFGYLFGL